jgi:predicted Zn finger-like uncharacterized protein
MSLITSCPSCGTMFRVVPDQLKISEGWVRCGHCSEVFDAAANLSDESVLGNLQEAQGTMSGELMDTPPAPPPPPPPPPPATAPPLPPRRKAPEQPTVPAELQTRPAELYARGTAKAGEPLETSETSSEPSDFFAEEADLEPSPLDAPFVFRRPEVSLADVAAEPGRESQMLPEEFDPLGAEDVPNVSFVRQARRRSLWSRPAVRLFLALLVLVLGALLALQVAYQDRDRLALAQPQLRPALEAMCDLLHCRLGPPRQIEAVVIDSSGFNRLRNDTYRLSFTLRNTAPVPVAVPAMELTITDAQDQTLARRVLTAAELGADSATIPAASDWSRTVGVVLDTGGSGRVAGYRLLAFYP